MRMFNRIFSMEFLLLPIYVYKLIQLFVLKENVSPLAISLRITITVLLLPQVIVIILLLAIYYHIIELILRWKHSHRFHSILDGCDRVWILKSPSKHVINAFYTIADTNDPNQSEELLNFFKMKYKIIAQTHPQFSSIIQTFIGIDYFHIIDLDFNLCIKYMDDYDTIEEFHALLEQYCNKDLPKGDTYLWEFYIGKKTIDWFNGKQYPLFIRYHHSLGDGVSLNTLMTTHLLDNGVEQMQAKCKKYKAILDKTPKKNSCWSLLKKQFSYPTISEPEELNLLHRGVLSGEKHLIFAVEKPGDGFIQKVKDVKNFYQVAFIDVVTTAISGALNEHFDLHTMVPTKEIICMNPYFLMSPDFYNLAVIKNKVPIVKLGNKFAMGFSKIPINMEKRNKMAATCDGSYKKSELIKRLELVRQNNDKLKNALDFPFCYWQLRMFAGLPMAVSKHLLLVNDATVCISNVPGNTTSKLTNGYEVTDTFVFANNYGDLGVTITLFTYDDRFRIGLLIDKCLVPDRKDAQLLGDNIFKYINALESTINN